MGSCGVELTPFDCDRPPPSSSLLGDGGTGNLARVNHLKRARAVFDIEIAGLKAVRDRLDTAFEQAVEVVVEALRRRGKVVVVGIGKSGNIGRKITATLTSTGSTSVVLHSVDALHGDLGVINDGDVVLALSYSGESEELLNLIPNITAKLNCGVFQRSTASTNGLNFFHDTFCF